MNDARLAVGFDQAALDVAAREGFANGAFEESAEEVPEIIDECLSEAGGNGEKRAAGQAGDSS